MNADSQQHYQTPLIKSQFDMQSIQYMTSLSQNENKFSESTLHKHNESRQNSRFVSRLSNAPSVFYQNQHKEQTIKEKIEEEKDYFEVIQLLQFLGQAKEQQFLRKINELLCMPNSILFSDSYSNQKYGMAIQNCKIQDNKNNN